MELTKDNLQQTLTSLRNKGLFALVSHIEKIIEVNKTEYPENSEWDTNRNYGAKLFLMKYVQEYVNVMKEHNLLGSDAEIEETVLEDNGKQSYYYLFLIGSESALAIYVIDED